MLKCRLYLAALHYNENRNREQAQTNAGMDRFSLLYPKYKKGGHVVRKVLVGCTYSKFTPCIVYIQLLWLL